MIQPSARNSTKIHGLGARLLHEFTGLSFEPKLSVLDFVWRLQAGTAGWLRLCCSGQYVFMYLDSVRSGHFSMSQIHFLWVHRMSPLCSPFHILQ